MACESKTCIWLPLAPFITANRSHVVRLEFSCQKDQRRIFKNSCLYSFIHTRPRDSVRSWPTINAKHALIEDYCLTSWTRYRTAQRSSSFIHRISIQEHSKSSRKNSFYDHAYSHQDSKPGRLQSSRMNWNTYPHWKATKLAFAEDISSLMTTAPGWEFIQDFWPPFRLELGSPD